MRKNRGFVLLMVVSASVMIIGGLLVSLFLLASTAKRTYYYHERLEAYYLCEVGVSKGLAVLKSGGGPKTGTIDFALGDKAYQVKYDITGSTSKPMVKGYVTMASGNSYFLKVGGERQQWPFFLKGMIPPLMDD
jgi:hypothetical protein